MKEENVRVAEHEKVLVYVKDRMDQWLFERRKYWLDTKHLTLCHHVGVTLLYLIVMFLHKGHLYTALSIVFP